jgi:aspartyl-tRNA(Asn)/glutamyl-tRNA(Gln) amidotransferase subunit C
VNIDDSTLKKLEKLSHLNISEDKREEIIEQLSKILEYVENLNELDTSNLDSYFSTLSGGTPMREDVPFVDSDIPKIILENAPEAKDDFFIVPAIIE